ncbi:TPA: IS3 family transposase [Staphylococcus aureus]|uniref:IS3 family transposase n=1 Tax=Staphylococcus warneri TaxID=1292 RepID=UPI0002E7075E|nr:IS3 family transposase [Staphylococcus warneri]HDK7898520.1 IS3 family transposase [Staphylococcus aureus]HDM0081829.1 IS3 family transposase [Staphylococcus aureus]HDM8557263.1 IS3 family transposase [Staphylococcus aureus]
MEAIKEIYDACDYNYGYRRVTQTLKNRGTTVNHKNHKCSSYKGTIGKVSNNLLKRRFKTDRPFQKIVTDITEFKLFDGTKLYLSPFMNLYTSDILSYSISTRPKLSYDDIL